MLKGLGISGSRAIGVFGEVDVKSIAWAFGEPTLESGGVGRASWTKSLSVGTQRVAWAAKLDAGKQTSWDDYAKVIVPVNELPFKELESVRLESNYGVAVGADMAVCVYMHDPNDFDQHIELSHTPMTNAGTGYRELNYPTDIPGSSWGWYGNVTDTPNTCPLDWDSASYTWAQFQADSVFRHWTIYRITFDYGYQTGDIVLSDGYLCQAQINGVTIPLKPSAEGQAIIKAIQAELLAITAVAANAQQKSSVLDLADIRKVAIFIDHARDATTAFVAVGTEYRVEVSEKASGNDTWRTIASVVCGIAAATDIVMDNEEPVGETVIHCTSAVPTKGDIVFFKNATIANSEWAKVVAVDASVGTESFTIQDGLTKVQAALAHMYNKAEQFVLSLDVEPFTRLRVVVNNNNAATTNVAIVSRVAAITEA